jgi:hypothetical protein
MVLGNAFPNYKGSNAFSSREGVSQIKVLISNKEPLLGFGIYL